LFASPTIAVGQSAYDGAQSVSLAGRQLTLIPTEAVKRLDITTGPRPDAAAPIIGTYWNCREVEVDSPFAKGVVFESCGLTIVVCEDEGPCWALD
jgi:hypothetical protein